MNDKLFLIILTRIEWKNWVRTTFLKISEHRIISLSDANDRSNFFTLMRFVSDEIYDDDGAYIIASLSANYESYINNLAFDYLFIEAVEKFYPVSKNGYALFINDAERFNISLGKPIFANLWNDWILYNRKMRGLCQAKILVNFFNLTSFPDIKIHNNIEKYFLDYVEYPNDVDQSKYEGYAIHSCLVALSMVKHLNKEKIVEIFKKYNIKDYTEDNNLVQFKTLKQLLSDKNFISFIKEINKIILTKYEFVSIQFLMFVIYYISSLPRDKITFRDIVSDMRLCFKKNADIASKAIYYIGASIDQDTFANFLYNNKNKNFLFLNHKK